MTVPRNPLGSFEDAPVGVGVVGLGYWGPNLVRNLAELPEARLVAVCDRDPAALAKVERRYPAVGRLGDFEELLAEPEVDAIVIATPVATHAPLARAALRAGKHVFVEKPLAASADEAAALDALARESGLVLMTGHTFLYSPSVNYVRDRIVDGTLGDVHFISMSRVNLGIHQPDVSVVWDLGPHDFSILRYWLGGPPVAVSAVSRACVLPDKPDVAFINLEFASGTITHVELAWLAPSKLRRTTIVGTKQMIVYDDTAIEPVRVFDSSVVYPQPGSFGEYHLSYRTGDVVSPRLDAVEPLLLEMRDFCAAVATGSEPRASGPLALDVIRTIEAVDLSLCRGGERVVLEPADLVTV